MKQIATDDLHECQNCSKIFLERMLINPVPDLTERIAPGEIMPSGECPECGAVCHPLDTSHSVTIHVRGGNVEDVELPVGIGEYLLRDYDNAPITGIEELDERINKEEEKDEQNGQRSWASNIT